MSLYMYDNDKSEKIKELNEKISNEQKQVFDILLNISQSFSNDKYTKKQRDEMFEKVDKLKQNIKGYNDNLKKLKQANVKNNDTCSDPSFKESVKLNEKIDSTIVKLEDSLKSLDEDNLLDKIQNNIRKEKSEITKSKRKNARTQLVVVEDDDSISGKIKGFFNRLRTMIYK